MTMLVRVADNGSVSPGITIAAGSPITFTLYAGSTAASATSTGVSCALSSSTPSCNSTHAVSISAGEQAYILTSGNPSVAGNVQIGLVCQ